VSVEYSPSRRTALVLCGTGAHGAYHAGVLRAVHEAGVKIDVMAGHGVGAGAAALAAIDGASALWDAGGMWRGPQAHTLYGWKPALPVAGWLAVALGVILLTPLVFLALGTAIPGVVAILALIAASTIPGVLLGGTLLARRRAPVRRQGRGEWWWSLAGAPLDAGRVREIFSQTIWKLIRGAAAPAPPVAREMGRRYGEALADSLGQPGVRELVIVASDLDARQDLVAALLREPFRPAFFARREGSERPSETLDLAGSGRDYALDVVLGALTPAFGADPHLVRFAPDSYWRGETHRLCDRPGSVGRLIEELDAAAVEQVIIVSAVRVRPVPHNLAPADFDIRSRLGDVLAAAEASALRDALVAASTRFDAIYVVRPEHNPVGPFDVGGAYDGTSDRHQTLAELMERGYDDAHRQFIEPIVGASGDRIGVVHGQGVLDQIDPSRRGDGLLAHDAHLRDDDLRLQ
jgi:hypothetical protein